MLPSPRAEQLSAILFISMSRIAFRHSVSSVALCHGRGTGRRSRFPARPVSLGTTRSDPVRSARRGGRFFCASFAQNLGEHSFAEEAKVEANYRVASREGGLMLAIPYDGSYSVPPSPLFAPAVDDVGRRLHVGVKEYRPLRKFYHRYVRLCLLLSLCLLVSIRCPRAFVLKLSLSLFYRILLGSLLLSIGASSFFSHGSVQYGTS